MARTAHYTPLLNGCYRTEISVYPKNWRTKKAPITTKNGPVEWYIWYRFHDPAHRDRHPNGKLVKIRGMNKFQNLEMRQADTQNLIDEELRLLDTLHFNPITKKQMYTEPEKDAVCIPVDDRTLSTKEYLALLDGIIPEPHMPFIQALWLGLKRVPGVDGTITDIGSVIRGTETAAKALQFDMVPIQDIRKKNIRLILEKCAQLMPRWSNARHNKYRAYLHRIFKPLVSLEAIEMNPVADIETLKETKHIRAVLTREQRKLISDHLRNNQYRFWLFIQIFFHSGARETELMRIKASDVELAGRRYKVLIKKGKVYRWVWKAIKEIAVPFWEEVLGQCSDENWYLFSKHLKPGESPIRPDQVGRRWNKYVKDPETGLGIDVDLYALKHLNTTEIINILSDSGSIEEAEKAAAELNSHTTTNMVTEVYDVGNADRKLDRLRRVSNSF